MAEDEAASGGLLHHVLSRMSQDELLWLRQQGGALFQTARNVADSGNHTYDDLGASGERITRVVENVLAQRERTGGEQGS